MRHDTTESVEPQCSARFEPPEIARAAVARPELVGRLDVATRGTLTVVRAPMGYGKTTLVAQWARLSARRVAWIRFQRDEHGRALADALVGAIAHVGADVQSGGHEHARTLGPELVRFLVDRLASTTGDIYLVLDRLDRVTADGRAHVGALIEQAPLHVHFVVTTRAGALFGPGAAPVSMRGDLAQFGPDDLAFDRATTRDVVEADLERPVSSDTIDNLFRRTGGWPAAIKFATLFLDAGLDLHAFLAAVSPRETAAYIAPRRQSDRPEGTAGADAPGLSPRERLVLGCLADRMTYHEIADRLFISQNTVKTHAKSVYTKLGVGSRREAVVRADQLGLL